MASHDKNAKFLQFLVKTINELIPPLDTVLSQLHEEGDDLPISLELIMGELTIVSLIFMDVDLNISKEEINLLNDFRKLIYGDKVLPFTAPNYHELCNECLCIYPHRRLSIDSLPFTVQYLQTYDQKNGTKYAKEAKEMFFRFAATIVRVDSEDWEEHLVLRNYRDVLYPKKLGNRSF